MIKLLSILSNTQELRSLTVLNTLCPLEIKYLATTWPEKPVMPVIYKFTVLYILPNNVHTGGYAISNK